jgi:prophage DNA circulation protein
VTILDDIVDIFLGGPDNWKERLKGTIEFISPEGNEFTAFWRGSPRTITKKLGIFSYPKVKGDIVQDLDVKSTIYPITFYFEGKNHDLEAKAFFQAAKERGMWEITHPVHGFLGLQLISITENDEPVTNGNITELNSEWIEPIDEVSLLTAREAKGIIDSKSVDLNLSSVDQFVANISQASDSLVSAIKTTTDGIQNVSDFVLSPLFSTVDAIDNAINGIQNGIQDTQNATVLQLTALAGQIQNLIEIPLLVNNDLNSRLDTYDDLIDGFFNLLPGEEGSTIPTKAEVRAQKNALAVNELALSAAIVSLAQIAITSELQSRSQVLEAISQIGNRFIAIINALEEKQEDFIDDDIDEQYFSQSQSFTDAYLIIYQTSRYLLSSIYDLQIERRFIIDEPRAPIEVTITEYGSLGDNDENFDLFIRTNNLKGPDILLLPRGKEVVVYV